METLFDLSPSIMATVPVIMALVEGTKQIGLPGKFAPVASIVYGIGLATLLLGWAVPTVVVVQGIMAGLLASGLYSGGKATMSPAQ